MKRWIEILTKNKTARYRLFCFHHGGAGASAFYPWIKMLPDYLELVAIQLPGRETRFTEPCLTSIGSVIELLQKDIVDFLDKPMVFFGHSLGGLVLFELVRSLQLAELPLPLHLIVSACKPPHLTIFREPIAHLREDEFISKLLKYKGIPQEILNNEEDLLSVFLPIIRADFTILESYQYKKSAPFACRITALTGRDDYYISENDIIEWQQYTTVGFKHFSVPGTHFFIKSAQMLIIKVIQQVFEEFIVGTNNSNLAINN